MTGLARKPRKRRWVVHKRKVALAGLDGVRG